MNTDRFALPGAAYDLAYDLAEQASESKDARREIREAAESEVASAKSDNEPYTPDAARDLWTEVRDAIGGFEIEDTGCEIRDTFEADDIEMIEICRQAITS